MLGALLCCGCASSSSSSASPRRPIDLSIGAGAPHASVAATAPASMRYLSLLEAGVARTTEQVPAIISSAETAATRVTRGGRLLVGGTQPEFTGEMIDRAGGLVGVGTIPRVLDRRDVILYAVRSRLTVGDRVKISHWRAQGVYVIAFASAHLSADPYFKPDVLIDSGPEEGLLVAPDGKLCPTDSVLNLMNAWTWTGEYVAACTRLGKMPVLRQSLGEGGAHRRMLKYRGKAFHDDMKVPPTAAGSVADAYLHCAKRSLRRMREDSVPTFAFAANWLRDAGPEACGLYAASAIYPASFADERAPQPFARRGELQLRQAPSTPVSVVIGYQDPPQIAIDAATMRRTRVFYTSSRRDLADGRPEVLYVDPHWPIEDACVAIAGYDIPILPASSVMQAAVYWSLVAETAAVPTRRGALIATSRTPGE